MRRIPFVFVFGLLAGCMAGCGDGGYTQVPVEDFETETATKDANATQTTAANLQPEPTKSESSTQAQTPVTEAPPVESQAAAAPAPPADPPERKPYKPQSTTPGRAGGMIRGVLGARNRNTGSSNGKQLALAMMQNDRVPPQAIVSSEGTPLLSWRVKILQTLDQNLYNAFNHEVAWDHPDNMKLIEQMPSFFDAGYPLDEGHTVMMAVVGDDTMFPDPTKVKRAKRGLAMSDCRDGASKTILFAIAHPEMAVPWTKPQDIEFNPDDPGDGLIGPDETILAVFCDGSVRRLSGLDQATIKAILTRKGGEVVGSLD